MNEFPVEKINDIKKSIDRALADGATPVAAFDADGTLWDTDLGDHFFNYQIKNQLIPDMPQDPWSHYHKIKSVDAQRGFLWLAQINKNQKVSTVREWADMAFKEFSPPPIFNWAVEIIEYLKKQSVDIYIVTASITWAVEPGAKRLGIPIQNVVGVNTCIENGIITDKQNGAITWHEGKVTALLQSNGKKVPFFAAGNTMGDLALLESATHIRVVNCAAPEGDSDYETEKKLIDIAKTKCWFYHQY